MPRLPISPQVFLIAEGNRSALNRGLNELRRRQLFTFQLDEVAGVKVAWQDGNATALELASGEKHWTAPRKSADENQEE